MKDIQQIFELEPRRTFKKYLNKEAYNSMPDNMKKQLLEGWRAEKGITIKNVCDELEINEYQYYDELNRLGIPYAKRNYISRKKQKLSSTKKPQSSCVTSFEGTSDPTQLQDLLTRIELQINENAFAYNYVIRLEEIAE
jgi:hypothetical protein